MAVYNVPEKINMLQQNHLQDLNVSEGGYELTLAAAFEQSMYIVLVRIEMKLQCGQIKHHRLQPVVIPASQRVSTTAAAIYAVSRGTLQVIK